MKVDNSSPAVDADELRQQKKQTTRSSGLPSTQWARGRVVVRAHYQPGQSTGTDVVFAERQHGKNSRGSKTWVWKIEEEPDGEFLVQQEAGCLIEL
jgi:hypothetical protein